MALKKRQRVWIVTEGGLRPGRITQKRRGRGFRVVGDDGRQYTTQAGGKGEQIRVKDIYPYLWKGQRVRAKVEGRAGLIVGRITKNENGVYRVKDDKGQLYTTRRAPNGRGKLIKEPEPVPPSIFVFDTMLDEQDFKGQRQAGGFWKKFCVAASWDFNSTSVHSLVDLGRFLSKPIPSSVIIFNGHGYDGKNAVNQAGLSLSFGDVFCPEQENFIPRQWILGTDSSGNKVEADLHPENRSKLVVFSSCLIGNNPELCESFRDFFRARAVVAYSRVTYDDICFLAEPLIVYLIESCGFTPKRAVEHVRETLRPLRSIMARRLRAFPIQCFGGNL